MYPSPYLMARSLPLLVKSGSGKSTLVRAAFGMLKQASISGQILLNGIDVLH